MKRFLILLSLLFCNTVLADTINLHWLNEDGSTYQNSTCVIDSDLILPSTPPTKYGYTFTGWKISNYIPIEYLNTNSGAMINTGIIPLTTQGLYVNIKFKFNSIIASSVNGIWGYMYSRSTTTPRFGLYYDSSILKAGSGLNNTQYFEGLGIKSDKIYESIFTNGYITLDGYSIFVGTNNTDNNFIPIYFGARADNQGNPTWPSDIDIYEFEIIYNDVHKYFVPVLDQNGTPCMYDKVEGKFYYNAGTGSFVAGPAVTK